MAQPVHCDIAGMEPHLADVLVSQIANGDTTAWCFTHYVDVCLAVIQTAQEAAQEAAQTDQAAEDRLAGVTAPDQAEPAQDGPQAAPTAPEAPTGPDDGPGGAEGDQLPEAGLGGSQPIDQEGAEATAAGA